MSQGEVSHEGILEFARTHGYTVIAAGAAWNLFLRKLDEMGLPSHEVNLEMLSDFCVLLRQRNTRPTGFGGAYGDLLLDWCDSLLA